jgi:hypothetical protein
MATIGFMLNKLLEYKYNIHIIISWYFDKKGIENFDMNDINLKIENKVSNCDFFIYHNHINSYHINASNLPNLINKNCLKLCVPNYRLDYLNDNYNSSLNLLKYQIQNSDFSEFIFIINNHKIINFFNTTNHPTHYLLFLQSQSIIHKISKSNITIDLDNYYDKNNRNYFKAFSYVVLPGKENITNEIFTNTGIKIDSDYFD